MKSKCCQDLNRDGGCSVYSSNMCLYSLTNDQEDCEYFQDEDDQEE